VPEHISSVLVTCVCECAEEVKDGETIKETSQHSPVARHNAKPIQHTHIHLYQHQE